MSRSEVEWRRLWGVRISVRAGEEIENHGRLRTKETSLLTIIGFEDDGRGCLKVVSFDISTKRVHIVWKHFQMV